MMTSVSSRAQLMVIGLHALLGVSVLIAATVLSALHDPISSTISSLFGIILGMAGAGSAAVAVLGTAVNGKAAIPQGSLADIQTTMRLLVDHLAGARQQIDAARLPPVEPVTTSLQQPPEPIPATS